MGHKYELYWLLAWGLDILYSQDGESTFPSMYLLQGLVQYIIKPVPNWSMSQSTVITCLGKFNIVGRLHGSCFALVSWPDVIAQCTLGQLCKILKYSQFLFPRIHVDCCRSNIEKNHLITEINGAPNQNFKCQWYRRLLCSFPTWGFPSTSHLPVTILNPLSLWLATF